MCIFGGQAVQIILCRGHTLHCTTVFVDTFSWKWWVWNLEEESPGGPENAWHISHSPFAVVIASALDAFLHFVKGESSGLSAEFSLCGRKYFE